jgi:hypothetical protein
MYLALFALGTARGADSCPDPTPAIGAAEEALAALRLADAHAALGEIEASFGCGPAATPAFLGRFWQATAVLAELERDPDSADQAFAAAARSASGDWQAVYGAKLRARLDEVASRPVGAAELRISPEPIGLVTRLDGGAITAPLSIASGLHVLQIGASPDSVAFGRVVFAEPGDVLTVTHPVAPLPPAAVLPAPVAAMVEPVTPPEPQDRQGRRRVLPLALGGGGVATGIASAVVFSLSFAAYDDYRAEPDDIAAEGIWDARVAPTRGIAFATAISSAGLFTAAGVAVARPGAQR